MLSSFDGHKITVGPHEFEARDITRGVHAVITQHPKGFIAGDVIEELKGAVPGFDKLIRAHQDNVVSNVLQRLATNKVLAFDRVQSVWKLTK